MKSTRTSRSSSTTTSTTPKSGVPLLIVESPAKAKVIKKYLGSSYMVEASVGHIADIPKRKGSVRTDQQFGVTYELTDRGAATLDTLRKAMKKASKLVLATDADREGELIAAHIVEFLAPTIPVERIVFQSVTKDAILEALANPREIDQDLVEAARVRRIIDRLYGFEVSPVLWATVRSNLSAGRVQSPALRLVVEREFERQRFVSAAYSDVIGTSATDPALEMTLTSLNGRRIAVGKDFDALGQPSGEVHVLTSEEAASLVDELLRKCDPVTVTNIKEQSTTRKPQPPFTLSTLLQTAGNKLGMSGNEINTIATKLYQNGHITYVRTDNPMVTPATASKLRRAAQSVFGDDYVAPKIRYIGGGKKALVQGAHEGIHPTNPSAREVKGLTAREQSLYSLIWQRALASQMADSRMRTRSITLECETPKPQAHHCVFVATGSIVEFPGFRIAYGKNYKDDGELPECSVGDLIQMANFVSNEHATTPPPRFNESSLVKELEELGIGRPSTYMPIMKKLRERYVWSKGSDRALIPTISAYAVYRVMSKHLSDLIDYDFTKAMEKQLDEVSEGERSALLVLNAFFFGEGEDDRDDEHRAWPGLEALVSGDVTSIPRDDLIALEIGVHPESGERIVVRSGVVRKKGAFTPYIECGSTRCGISDETTLDELTVEKALALLSHNANEIGMLDGAPVLVKKGQYGYYFQWGAADALPPGEKKPRTAGFTTSMSFESVTLEDAERMFAFPRVLGAHPETHDDVEVLFGPFGAYVRCADNTRSIRNEDDAFTIDLAAALELLATPKSYRGRGRGRKSGAK